jgi:hypothetical protein
MTDTGIDYDTIKPVSDERRAILVKARAARTLAKRRRWAAEMRAAGWKVEEPK